MKTIIIIYLRAVESHAGENGLGDARPLQLVPDLLVDVGGDVGGRCIAPGVIAHFGGAPRDGRVVEELLVKGLWVLVGQQTAHSQLLVDEVGHS